MANFYPPNRLTTNQVSVNTPTFDWTTFIADAMLEGGQTFLKTISSADPSLDKAQLTQQERQADQLLTNALARAKRARTNPGPHLLAATRNWSRKQAIALLCEKVAGKPIPQDFYPPFQLNLHQEIATMVLDLQLFWEQQDEQQAVAKRDEAERAFGAAYPVVRGLSDVVLTGERERRAVFESGQQAVQEWAKKYEESVEAREKQVEERIKRIQQQESENRAHQLAQRSLARWDDTNSFVNTVVNTGKNTIGCLFVWLLLIAGIILAIYLAFPHH